MGMTKTITKTVAWLFFFMTASVWGADASLLTPTMVLVQQRADFSAARQAIKQGKSSTLAQLRPRLENYPLYPYLDYWSLNRRLTRAKAADIQQFIERYGDTPLAGRLRYRWLMALAKSGQWQKLLQHYRPSNDTALQCHYRRALYKSGNFDAAFDGIEKLWLVGKSQPRACDPLFAAWQETPRFSADLAWQRVQLAMHNNQPYLARYLERFLDADKQRITQLWRRVHRDPEKMLRDKALGEDSPWARQILVHGIKRLARLQPVKAANMWDMLMLEYAFRGEQIVDVEKYIALRLASRNEAEAMHWLVSLADDSDTRVRQWRVLAAMREGEWEDALFWLNNLYPEEQTQRRWLYWRARALEQLDQTAPAHDLYTELARERSYYGFLAADRLGQPYRFEDRPLSFSPAELEEIARHPGIERAREFYALGDMVNARREWLAASRALTTLEKEKAAKLAQLWGWYDRAITTLSDTDYRDDLELRFPLAHNAEITQNAATFDIDPAWAYAIIRQESAFTRDARSPKGALGLMQIMPSTGKTIAKALNTRLSHPHQLLDASTNIRFGINYLRRVMARFGQNMVLATAAYNAGSARVKSWLPNETDLPADQWIEFIPYKETRNYLKNVLSYTIIYDQRLERDTTPLKQRMPVIAKRPGNDAG